MNGSPRPPRFLPEVLEAIYELRETGGSTSNKIVTRVAAALRYSRNPHSTPRNLTVQVRRALNYATTNRIVRQRAGKFRLNRDFLEPCKICSHGKRRRKRRRGRSRRGRRRKMNDSLSSVGSESSDYRFESDIEDEFPVRRVRRRRRKTKQSPRRRRRRRSKRTENVQQSAEDKNKISENDNGRNVAEELAKNVVYSDDYQDNEPNGSPMEIDPRCDNPECLCNVKEEIDDNQNFDPQL